MHHRIIIGAFALALPLVAGAQARPNIDWPEYEFVTVKANPITSIKNQNRSGTCWAFSTIGFVESEVIRINGLSEDQYPDFSEMFVVSHSYMDRAKKYIMVDGNLGFSAGSEGDDVLHVIADYGLVPQDAMPGLNYGTELPVHGELDAILKGYVEAVAKNPNRTLSTAWQRGFQSVLDAYLGEYPQNFTVGGVTYTPESWRDALKFNPDDYVTLTSFTHHPFYTKFAIEVADNWRWDEAYNLPVDEFMEVLENAVNNGYTVAWGTDVSSPGFTRDGLAVLVDVKAAQTSGSDQERWVGKDAKSDKKGSKKGKDVKKQLPPKELEATQESRQKGWDDKSITDDHGMQIYGIAKDQWGGKYYMVKNSWGEAGKYGGIWYASEAFVKNQSMDYIVHKDALPQALKDKLGIR